MLVVLTVIQHKPKNMVLYIKINKLSSCISFTTSGTQGERHHQITSSKLILTSHVDV